MRVGVRICYWRLPHLALHSPHPQKILRSLLRLEEAGINSTMLCLRTPRVRGSTAERSSARKGHSMWTRRMKFSDPAVLATAFVLGASVVIGTAGRVEAQAGCFWNG